MDEQLMQKFAGLENRLESLFKMIQADARNTGLVGKDIEYMKRDIGDIKSNLEGRYATKDQVATLSINVSKCVTSDQFDPVRKVVYGIVTLVLTGVILALLGLVIIKR